MYNIDQVKLMFGRIHSDLQIQEPFEQFLDRYTDDPEWVLMFFTFNDGTTNWGFSLKGPRDFITFLTETRFPVFKLGDTTLSIDQLELESSTSKIGVIGEKIVAKHLQEIYQQFLESS